MRNVIITVLMVLSISISALAQEDVKYEYATLYQQNLGGERSKLSISTANEVKSVDVTVSTKIAFDISPSLKWISENGWEIMDQGAFQVVTYFTLRKKK
jgi:hypothetical protein